MLSLDCTAAFDPAHAEEFLDALPARPAVLLIEPRADLENARPLLLRTADLRRRLRLLLSPSDPNSRRVNLREYAASIRYRLTASAFEQVLMQWQQARVLWPTNYRQRLRLHPPALVKLNVNTSYPRAFVTRRFAGNALYAGPFQSRRAAEAFLDPALDLFRIRRCQIKIRRDPTFPGCIYSEMKMCLAPCFAGCTAEEYVGEVGHVAAFLSSGGASLAQELSREREQASAALDFERAAALHRRLEKVEAVRRVAPELARRVEDLNAVILQLAAEQNTIAFFIVRAGRLADPFLIDFAASASRPRSPEQILREQFEQSLAESIAAPGAESAVELEDHLSLLARWFYARPRAGEIFFEQPQPAGWPYRKILRACSRLLEPPKPEPPKPEPSPA
jgi:excinuclease ABC subunit C